jgi:hypothetical protein
MAFFYKTRFPCRLFEFLEYLVSVDSVDSGRVERTVSIEPTKQSLLSKFRLVYQLPASQQNLNIKLKHGTTRLQ